MCICREYLTSKVLFIGNKNRELGISIRIPNWYSQWTEKLVNQLFEHAVVCGAYKQGDYRSDFLCFADLMKFSLFLCFTSDTLLLPSWQVYSRLLALTLTATKAFSPVIINSVFINRKLTVINIVSKSICTKQKQAGSLPSRRRPQGPNYPWEIFTFDNLWSINKKWFNLWHM